MNEQQTSGTTEIDPLDRIEKSIDIDASPEEVWGLVSRPGWWINDGTVDPEQEVRREEGEVSVVTHPEYGEFRLLTEAAEPPTYVAFRWLHAGTGERPQRSTLVEFRILPRHDGVTLSVTESGFAALSPDRAVWLADRSNNVEGWDTELAAARTFVEGS